VNVQSDVSVVKNGPPTITAGTNISYTIDVTSNGPSDATSVTMSDSLPANTTFVSFSSPAAWLCTTPASGGTGTISCSVATLTAGATANFTLTLKVSSTLMSGMLSNTATVSAAVDTNNGNNSSTSNAAITSTNNLAITKTGPATAAAGGSITYTIVATNNGPSDASVPHVMDNLPANTTFASLTVPSGWSCTTPAVGSGGSVACDVAGIWSAGSSSTFTLTLGVSPAATNGSTIANTVTIDSPAPGHASATTTATVSISADVAVTKTAPANITPGSSIAYTINVTNNGPNLAQNVTLADTLPANTTFTSLSAPAGWSCTTPAVGGTGAINCSVATLANAATATFTLTVATTAPANSTITNTATISTTSPDPTPANNTSSASTIVGQPADVAIVKTVTPPANLPNGTETYNIVVTNNGPGAATAVTVTDILPAGATLTSAIPSQGSCSGTTTVTCTLGTLNNGANATIAITVQAPATPGPVSNTATVTTTSNDPNAGNNSSTTSFNVVAPIPAMSPFALLLTAIALALGGAIALKARG
ncbi:MAG: Extracellular nuclease, partial [Acidobacteria bacterium]|nr:Extracellular nuclease [Acidobacteriota bacterium]